MTPAQARVLAAVSTHPGLRAKALTRIIGGAPRHVQRSLDALQRRSLVSFTVQARYYITERGQRSADA